MKHYILKFITKNNRKFKKFTSEKLDIVYTVHMKKHQKEVELQDTQYHKWAARWSG